MNDAAGFVILAMFIAYMGFQIWQGYRRETTPPLPLRDTGNGIMQPVCPRCHAGLVTLQRKESSSLVSVLAFLVGVIGIGLILINWLAGGVVIIVALLINMAGKSTATVLTCPACGHDAKTLN